MSEKPIPVLKHRLPQDTSTLPPGRTYKSFEDLLGFGYVHPYIGMTFRLHRPSIPIPGGEPLPEVNIPRAVCVVLNPTNGLGIFRDIATGKHYQMNVVDAVGPLEAS